MPPDSDKNGSTERELRLWLGLSGSINLLLAHSLQGAQVDEHVNQGVAISNGRIITDFGSFDAQGFGLAVNPFAGGALLVDAFVSVAVAVKLIAKASAHTGRHSGGTATLGPLFVVNGTALAGGVGKA